VTLTELRYVVAVARERHFGRAAQSCHVSQPTLSVAIKKLEEELRVQLFERGPAEVAVTPVGQRVVEQAQRVLEEAARVKEIAQAAHDPLAGPLRWERSTPSGLTCCPSSSRSCAARRRPCSC
jgi:LysR family hydrogen peroxide-inducible transcriptional activator